MRQDFRIITFVRRNLGCESSSEILQVDGERHLFVTYEHVWSITGLLTRIKEDRDVILTCSGIKFEVGAEQLDDSSEMIDGISLYKNTGLVKTDNTTC